MLVKECFKDDELIFKDMIEKIKSELVKTYKVQSEKEEQINKMEVLL